MSQLAAGTEIGAFVIESHLGTGGMGAVYVARNTLTDERRALKIIRPELAADPSFRSRFIREIRACIAVEHPNVVRVFEPGLAADAIFLPMELLEGETLTARLRRDGPLPLAQAVAIARGIANGLAAIHGAALVHRDVKPANVLLAQKDGVVTPKLLDLGAVKRLDSDDEQTRAGDAIGTEAYMSPEQARGSQSIDGRSDQFGFAIVVYQMLTGRRPWEGDADSSAVAKIISKAAYPSPRDLRSNVPEAVERIITRCLAHEREDRYPSMSEVVRELDASIADELEHTRPAPVAAPVPFVEARESGTTRGAAVVEPRERREKGLLPAVLLVGAATVLVATAAVALRSRAPNTPSASDTTRLSSPVARVSDTGAGGAPSPAATTSSIEAPDASTPVPDASPLRAPTKRPAATQTATASATARPTSSGKGCVLADGIPCDL